MEDTEQTSADRKVRAGDAEAQRSRGAFANAGWNAFSTAWGIAISFAISPVLIHNLGVTQYGILLLVWSITGVLGIVGCGFGEATLRYVAHHHGTGNIAGVNRVFGSTLTFYLTVCGLVLAVCLPLASSVVEHFKIPSDQQGAAVWLFRITLVTFSLGMVSSAFAAVPMALQRYDVSSKISILQNVVRSGGYIALAVAGFGILHLVLWELFVGLATLSVQVSVARRLLPSATLRPSFSFSGIREIFGYSSFSFLTHIFHTMYRESGKLILGSSGVPAKVAYLGTPESIAYRIYMVIISGCETLMPRFSASKDPRAAENLVSKSTWMVIAASVTLLIPLTVLMPDFLKLWIGTSFAQESSLTGQLMAASFVAPAVFASIATYFRGTGRPWIVTLVMAGAGIVVLGFSMLLVPEKGAVGVGIAYLLSSLPWVVGLILGWLNVFGSKSLKSLMRSALLPLVLAGGAFLIQTTIRARFGDLGWIGLFPMGALFALLTILLVVAVDVSMGGVSPARQLWERLARSPKGHAILRCLSFKKAQAGS